MSELETKESGGMSKTVKIVLGALAAIALIAIIAIAVIVISQPGEAEPTAVAPTAEPSGTAMAGDSSWERVKAVGKIVIGTAPDYPPFEFFVAQGQIDGFDVALMDEIGRRLGVQVEYRTLAFEGLGDALALKQIDAAIAAISITPERESQVDFSSVYLAGQDGILARQDASMNVGSVDDLAKLRVGAQRGSVYEAWLYRTLVKTGKMPEGNLLVYERAQDAVSDLQTGRVDLVVMDLQPAQIAVAVGGVKLVAEGLHQQRYALAMPQGAQALKAEIDRVLASLYNDGYIANLAKQYLDMDQLLPTPTAAPTSTPGPTPTCADGLALVQHLTQESEVKPGQQFTKGWRVVNTGTCTWSTDYRLVFVHGSSPEASMGGKPTAITRPVAPGETYDMQVELVAPLKPGTYYAYWQMQNRQGKAFGERLRVTVKVPANPTVTPAPTQTPAVGIVFTVDRNQIKAGECVNFYWNVQNVKVVYFYAEGENWQDNGVPGEGTQKECPPVTWTYYLRVVRRDDSVDERRITIYVEEMASKPIIERFTVDPPAAIVLGDCVQIRWKVKGDVNAVAITANEGLLWEPAPSSGSLPDCPVAPGTVVYGITAVGPGGTSQGSQTIRVVEDVIPATPMPTLPPVQPTEPPVEPTVPAVRPTPTKVPPIQIKPPAIKAFAVTPAEIKAGQSVGIRWSVSGGTAYSRILRAQGTDPGTAKWKVVIDNAGYIGQALDRLDKAGSYLYRLEAFNLLGESVYKDMPVTVTGAE
jgi:ABC-type amino acid transport substrate-binding protein